jgi:hypothetical protein
MKTLRQLNQIKIHHTTNGLDSSDLNSHIGLYALSLNEWFHNCKYIWKARSW